MPRRADSCARDRTARALTRPALALFFGGGRDRPQIIRGARLQNAGRAQCARSPAFRRREIGRLETRPPRSEIHKKWFLKPSKNAPPCTTRRFFFGVEKASRLRAFSTLVSSPALSRPLPQSRTSSARHVARPRLRLDVSLLLRKGSETTRVVVVVVDDASSADSFTLRLRVASPAAAPASAYPPCPRARRRPAPSSCPLPGRPRPSARR